MDDSSKQVSQTPGPEGAGEALGGVVGDLRRGAQKQASAYRNGEDRPLRGYVAVMAVFLAFVTGAAGLLVANRRPLPEQVGPWDVVLLALGSHKLSRTITKDAVTSPLRAPFTRYLDSGGPAEVREEVRRGSTFRHAVGELLTCPFCLDVWLATGFTLGLVFAPRPTRLVCAVFAVLTGADLMQLAYAVLQQQASGSRGQDFLVSFPLQHGHPT